MKKHFLQSVISALFYGSKEGIPAEMRSVFDDFLRIIHKNVDRIISLDRNAVKKLLMEELQRYFLDDTYKDDLPEIEQLEFSGLRGNVIPQGSLVALNVGGFRGFQAMRRISLHPKITIFYAENGSGKSCLCEALEFATTGDVEERIRRKCTEAQYFQNKYAPAPPFTNTNAETESGIIYPSEEYKRCFIEKNRIDTFGRLKERGIREIQKSLADLLGFGEITDLIRDFVSVDSFGLTSREKVSFNKEFIDVLEWDIVLRKLEEQKLAAETPLKEHFPDLILEQDDIDEEIKTRGLKLKNELEFPPTAFDVTQLKADIILLRAGVAKVDVINTRLLNKIDKLDSLGFFEAASRLLEKSKNLTACPLCDTDLSVVVTDPRKKTKQELLSLKEIKSLTEERARIIKEINPALRRMKAEYGNLVKNFSPKVLEQLKEIGDVTTLGIPALDLMSLELSVDKYREFKDYLDKEFSFPLLQLDEMFRIVNETKKKFDIKTIKITILRAYLTARKNITTHNARKLDYEKGKFLLESGYGLFRAALTSEEARLVQQESAGMNGRITGFYQALNQKDIPEQWVDKIVLPQDTSDHIKINIQGREFDALSMLSEGHLRTLGVAILLARAVRFQAPFLVFDDVVNAIDSDHRENVLALLRGETINGNYFGAETEMISEFMAGLQMIITSHENLFDASLAQRFVSDSPLRYFLSYGEMGVIEIVQPKDYLQLIQKRISEGSISEAAHICRNWIDDMSYKYAQKFQVKVQVGKETNTSFLVSALSREIKKEGSHLNTQLSDESKGLVADICKADGQGAYNNPEFINFWRYLNNSSHGIEAQNTVAVPHLNSTSFQVLFDALKIMEKELRELASR